MMNAMQSTAADYHPSALAEIYNPDVNIAIWQRQLTANVIRYTKHLVAVSPHWQTRFIQTPSNVAQQLERELPLSDSRQAFIEDVAHITDMFSCLFELNNVGFRMAVLSSAMCPKFHVDHVPCRLVCTYSGAGTQWHPFEQIERLDNGTLNPRPDKTPQSLSVGDVALLKGEAWEGNENRGLVHRSPVATENTRRIVLTLDFA